LLGLGLAAAAARAEDLPAPVPAAARHDRSDRRCLLSGRYGLELEGLSERFGSFSLLDPRFAQGLGNPAGDPIPAGEAGFASAYHESSLHPSGLLELRLDRNGGLRLHARGTVRARRTLTRGDLDLSGRGSLATGTFSISNRLFFQGGPEQKGAKLSDLARVSWTRLDLPGALECVLAASAERSWAASGSTSSYFEYRSLRPSVDLRRSFGGAGELALRGGGGRRWSAGDSLGGWRDRWWEVGWNHESAAERVLSVSVRELRRTSLGDPARIPSYRETTVEGQAGFPLTGPVAILLEPDAKRTAYDNQAGFFQSNWGLDTTLRLKTTLPWGAAGEEADLLGQACWALSIGSRWGLMRLDHGGSADQTVAGLLDLSREGSERFWFDLTMEGGRRSFRNAIGSIGLIPESADLLLLESDYAYVSGSALLRVDLGKRISVDGMGLFDREFHTQERDDSDLWLCTLSLARSF
jgi:hypothetical protein